MNSNQSRRSSTLRNVSNAYNHETNATLSPTTIRCSIDSQPQHPPESSETIEDEYDDYEIGLIEPTIYDNNTNSRIANPNHRPVNHTSSPTSSRRQSYNSHGLNSPISVSTNRCLESSSSSGYEVDSCDEEEEEEDEEESANEISQQRRYWQQHSNHLLNPHHEFHDHRPAQQRSLTTRVSPQPPRSMPMIRARSTSVVNYNSSTSNNNASNRRSSKRRSHSESMDVFQQQQQQYAMSLLWQSSSESPSFANPQSPPGGDEQLLQQQQQQGSGYLLYPPSARPNVSTTLNRNDSFQHPSVLSSTSSYVINSSTSNGSVSNQRHSFSIPLLLIGFIFVGFMAVGIAEMGAHNASTQVHQLETNKVEIDSRIKQYENDIRSLEREIEAMDLMIQQKQQDSAVIQTQNHKQKEQRNTNDYGQYQRAMNEMTTLQKRLRVEAQQAIELKREVQVLSKSDLITKYGTRPIRVEIQLVFPTESDTASYSSNNSQQRRHHHIKQSKIVDTGPTKFIIELAPIDMMPHSIHTFLEMVSFKLLDGCSFILNALHVVKAAPLPYDGSSAAEKAKAFAMHGLESVAFKEYNDNYPHKKYTIGFAADSSPSFYINTEDNSEIHVGDPCFGKVVDGFDAIRRLESSPTRNGIWFEKRIGIKSAIILPS